MRTIGRLLATIIIVGFLGAESTLRLVEASPTRQAGSPSFGQVTIAGDYADFAFSPIDVLDAYPSGLHDIIALLPVQNLAADTELDSEWFKDNVSMSTPSKDKYGPDVTLLSTSFHTDAGMDAGNWEVRYSLGGKVVATGKFKVVSTPLIYPFRFGTDASHVNYELINPSNDFPAGTVNISAVYRFYNLPAGQKGQVQWSANGAVVSLTDFTFDGATGLGIFALHGNGVLPSGEYALQISFNGTVLQSGKVKVK